MLKTWFGSWYGAWWLWTAAPSVVIAEVTLGDPPAWAAAAVIPLIYAAIGCLSWAAWLTWGYVPPRRAGSA